MDFTGSIIYGFRNLPDFWWAWMILVSVVTGLSCKLRKLSPERTIWIALLAAYVLFILFQTIIGREQKTFRAEWVPFWSYSHPELYMEIILNYLLFIPLGILLYGTYGEIIGLKVVLIGCAISAGIEITQLVFRIGLFEFDDIIGNTIGCLMGTGFGKVVRNAVRSYRNHRK